MDREIQVIIVEDDPFARNWMTLLVARDWRTRVVADFESPEMLSLYFSSNISQQVDIIVLDTETPSGGNWVNDALSAVTESGSFTRILCTGIVANERIIRKLNDPLFVGYVIKGEIPYSLAWAINIAMKGKWVTTPQIYHLASDRGLPIPDNYIVVDGHQSPLKLMIKGRHTKPV